MRCWFTGRGGSFGAILGALLVATLTLSVGCSKKGLYGIELGMDAAAAKVAFDPPRAGGSWSGASETGETGDMVVIAAAKAAPSRTVIFLAGGKVLGVRMRFSRAGIVAADENPLTFPEDLRAAQQVEGQTPFEHLGTKVWVGEGSVRTFSKDTEGFTVERFSRPLLEAPGSDCSAAEPIATHLLSQIDAQLGVGGARRREARAEVVARLRPLAAVADHICPEGSGVQTAVADFFRVSGAANGALERYRKALKHDQGWGVRTLSDAHAGFGAISFRYRKDAQAAEHYGLAISRATDSGVRARVARAYADDLHQRERYTQAAKFYQIFLDNAAAPASTGAASDLARVNARLLRAMIEAPGGCEKAKAVAARGLAIEGAEAAARGAMLAAEAFRIIACDPKHKKKGYARLQEAVKLDPLMAAEWSRLTAYYDREAVDASILKVMVDQGWIDPKGLSAARAYQKELREEAR